MLFLLWVGLYFTQVFISSIAVQKRSGREHCNPSILLATPELEICVPELLRSRLAPFWCLKASAYLMTDQLHEVLAMKQQQVV